MVCSGLLEGMADIERQAYRAIADKGGTAVQRVYTAGGGSKNLVWTALRAQALGVPVQQSRNGAFLGLFCAIPWCVAIRCILQHNGALILLLCATHDCASSYLQCLQVHAAQPSLCDKIVTFYWCKHNQNGISVESSGCTRGEYLATIEHFS